MLGNLRRNRLRSLGDAGGDPSIVPNDGGDRDVVRYWPPLDQRDDLGRPSDHARATGMIASG